MYSTHARALTCEVRWRGDSGCRKSVVTFSSLLQAYKRGLRYPKYQFLIFGFYSEGWLEEPGSIKELDCTLEERIRTLDYTLAVDLDTFNNNASFVTEGELVRLTNKVTGRIVYIFSFHSQTFTEFQEQYWEKLNSPLNRDIKLDELVNGNFFPYAQHCHEATLALAFALSNTQRGIKYIVIAPHVLVQSLNSL